MKKTWEVPVICVQQFEANEYVAACITGTIQCVYPGKSPSTYDDGTNTYRDSEGMWHGLCGTNATINFNGDTASGFEVVNGVAQPDRPIYDINGFSQAQGTYYVTWTSMDVAGGNVVYHHKGRLIITNVDENRPNHS